MTAADRLNRWLERTRRRVQTGVAPGVYPYLRQADGQQTRFHLRVDADGGGVLLANATMAARLTPTGTLIAKRLLDGDDPHTVARNVRHAFRGATAEVVHRDVEQVQRLIGELAAPGDNYPILNLSDAAFGVTPAVEKPLSADLPLADPERIVPILDRLWRIGIPHVTLHVLTRPDPQWLVRAVERAEDLGMIAGVRGRAGDLDQPELLKQLALAGVDHVNLYCLSADAALHDRYLAEGDHARAVGVIEQLQSLEVCPVAEVPLLESTVPSVDRIADALLRRGVTNLAFFALAAAEELLAEVRSESLSPDGAVQAAALIEESSAAWNVRSLWYPPVRRDPQLPSVEQIRRGPGSSGDHAIRVATDGTVFPPRGPRESCGNVLHDDWDALRGHPAFERYRAKLARPTHCDACPGLTVCAAECPRTSAGWVESWPPPKGAGA